MGDQKPKKPTGGDQGDDGMEVMHRHSGYGAEEMFKPSGAKDPKVDSLVRGVPTATGSSDHGAHRINYGSTGARASGRGPMPAVVAGASAPATGLSQRAKLMIGGGAAAAGVIAGLIVVLSSGGERKPEAGSEPVGAIEVVSVPAGAEIWMNGRKTEFETPHTFSGLPVESAARFSVKLAGYKVSPAEQSVKVPASKPGTASFQLRMAQPIYVVSNPPNADVSINGEIVGATPAALAPQALGDKLVIEVDLAGYLKSKRELVMSADTSTLSFELKRALEIDVISEPEGAIVFVDDEERGTTPAMKLRVPEGAFKLRIERPGYKPSVQKLNSKRIKEPISVTLTEQSLLALPLNKTERAEALNHTSALNRARAAAERAKKALQQAERINDKVMNSTNVGLQDRALAEQKLADAQAQVEATDEALTEIQQTIDAFRNDVMHRLDLEAEAKKTP